ncbi:MAG: o-succinylbenzoate--CoA ligase [Bacteroidia bacterium]|nr:o-succinylbenzoate--CoA ligase [Bacteroidia bacterium]MDW8158595.1 o-succinylbenzoate--CoA ligase [Bacteroidia bacterium]
MQLDWLEKWTFYSPHKVAVADWDTQKKYTYQMLNRLAKQAAALLINEYHVLPQDRVALIAENSVEHFILMSAAQKIGFILAPLNYRLSVSELQEILHEVEPKLLIIEQKFFSVAFQSFSYAITTLENFQEQVNSYSGALPERYLLQPSEENMSLPLFLLYTTGSTGKPKGVIYTHKMAFWNSINTALRLDLTSQDSTFNVMPLFHTGGWNVFCMPFLHHGASFWIARKFLPQATLTCLAQEKCTLFMGVPTMLQMMAQAPNFEEVDLSSVRYFLAGGEPCPIPLIDTWAKKGIPIRQGYGMTEAGPSVTSLHQDDAIRKKGSIGTINFYFEMKIVPENSSSPFEEGEEEGELWLKGPAVTPGYWRNEVATKEAFENGWLKTGDIVKKDKEGYLYIIDRKKNMFISGGENIYPAEIERCLYGHPDIQEVVVVGIPDSKWGEVGMALVVKKKGSDLSETQILEYCVGKIAKFKIPKIIRLVEELPKNDAGKLDRKKIKQQYLASYSV